MAVNEAEVVKNLKDKFAEVYGPGDVHVYFAAGRVNLIGEHIDYNGGHVFPCALTLGTYGAIRKRTDRKLRFFSMNFPDAGITEKDLDSLTPGNTGWTSYVEGVIWAFAQDGYKCDTGFDFMCYGTLPNKSGLSSSASLEVLTGTCLIGEYGFPVDQIHNALYGQKSENDYVGMNCGIMDQFASAMGKKDHAIFLDCATLDYHHAPVKLDDAKIVIVNTNKPHELVDSAYNDRRRECETALKELQAVKPGLKALCELKPEEFEQLKDAIKDPVCRKRAKHAVYEEARSVKAYDELNKGNIEEFGKLMDASHVSLRDDFEVTCKELDTLAEEAWKQPGTIGGRMTGGGFGGCTVNIVKNDAIDDFVKNVGDAYEKKIGYPASFYIVEIGDGPHRVDA